MAESGLKGRVAVITMNGDGLVEDLKKRLAEEGCVLAIIDHGRIEGKRLDAKIRKKKGTSFYAQVDLTNKKEVGECFDAIWDLYGHLDILINTAEVQNPLSSLAQIDIDTWNRVLELNLKGTFLACREAVRLMRPQKCGRIINLTSTLSLDLPACSGPYAISKLGINAVTEVLAKEEGRHNIRVNAIALEGMLENQNAVHRRGTSASEENTLSHNSHRSRLIQEQVVETILFLISDESDYITGQVIDVSGRLQIHGPD
jgi:3-oxoacyl-[acyl-carrier protein] reductase